VSENTPNQNDGLKIIGIIGGQYSFLFSRPLWALQ